MVGYVAALGQCAPLLAPEAYRLDWNNVDQGSSLSRRKTMRSPALAWFVCAWVAWQHVEQLGIPTVDGKPRVEWGIGEIFETRVACESHLRREVDRGLADTSFGFKARLLHRALSTTILAESQEDAEKNKAAGFPVSGIRTSYRCLPSGTDPRPR